MPKWGRATGNPPIRHTPTIGEPDSRIGFTKRDFAGWTCQIFAARIYADGVSPCLLFKIDTYEVGVKMR